MKVLYTILLFLVVLFVFLLYDYGSVKTIDPQPGQGMPVADDDATRQVPGGRTLRTYVGRLAIGDRFDSLDQLIAALEAGGFVKVGMFGNHWPATVVETQFDSDRISFLRQDGTRHNYTGFDGYRMQMVRLKGVDGRETLVVFRSSGKQ